jgi:hypothetical protein
MGGLFDGLGRERSNVLSKLSFTRVPPTPRLPFHREQTYVAVKISVAEAGAGEMRELHIMQDLASQHPHPKHMAHMLDDFHLKGPNGSHKCLVYELLGPNVPDMIDAL